MADVKGDLSGISQAGTANPKVEERVQQIGMKNYVQRDYPVAFWDLFGEKNADSFHYFGNGPAADVPAAESQ